MSSSRNIAIALFRNDLRMHDNAVIHAVHEDSSITHILPLYVWDERHVELSGFPGFQRSGPEARTRVCGFWRTGALRARFLAECVDDFRLRLAEKETKLLIRYGKPEVVTENMVKALLENGDRIAGVWLQAEICIEELTMERNLKKRLDAAGVPLNLIHSKLLVHPDDLPFPYDKVADVFTPYRKRIERINTNDSAIRPPLPIPTTFKPFPSPLPQTPDYGAAFDEADLYTVIEHLVAPLGDAYPSHVANSAASPGSTTSSAASNQDDKTGPHVKAPAIDGRSSKGSRGTEPRCRSDPRNTFPFRGGETAALARVKDFFLGGHPPNASTYKKTRNKLLGHEYSTKFSPWFASGSLSPREVIVQLREHEKQWGGNENTYWLRFELLWRDYFMLVTVKYGSQLFKLWGFEEVTDNKQTELKKEKPWKEWDGAEEGGDIWKWIVGETGVPFIDANMVELRETGFMSNRGRQNVASFLNKDLYVDWRVGAEFFEANLIDFEPCANYANWQYVVGVGNDPRAARYFNSIKQANDYDGQGKYVRQWRPQLRNVPNEKVHAPWLLSKEERHKYGIPEGDTYTRPPVIEPETWKPHYVRKKKNKSKGAVKPIPSRNSDETDGAGLESDSDREDDGEGDGISNTGSGTGSGHSGGVNGNHSNEALTRQAVNHSGSDGSSSDNRASNGKSEKDNDKEKASSWWRGGGGLKPGASSPSSNLAPKPTGQRSFSNSGMSRQGSGYRPKSGTSTPAGGAGGGDGQQQQQQRRSEASTWRRR